MTVSAADWSELQETIAGDVVLPDAPEYDAVRKPAMFRFQDVRPQAVVRCHTDADVGNVIGFAKRFGLRTAVRSGGHCFAGRSSTDGVVIDVSPMRSVTVTDGAVTVGAGTRLGELYDALDRHGLTIAAGCGPTVGIAGLTLGGGLGILGRRYGLTCDQLRWARVVLADGRVVECSERRDEDMFWALRGAGGGTLGVVTSLDFATVPAPPGTGFHLVWPHSAAAAVIEAWQVWAPDAPDELAASLLVKAGSDADRPAVVNVFGAMLGTESTTVDLLDELVARAGQDPTSADHVYASYREVKRYLVDLGDRMEGDASHRATSQPGPVYSKSEFFRRPLPTRRHRGAGRQSRQWQDAGRVASAGLHPVGRRLQPGATTRDSLRPSCRAVPAQARARPRRRRVGRHDQCWAPLADAVVDDGASVGIGWRVSELPRSRARERRARLLPVQSGAPDPRSNADTTPTISSPFAKFLMVELVD